MCKQEGKSTRRKTGSKEGMTMTQRGEWKDRGRRRIEEYRE